MDADGDFLVAWNDAYLDGSGPGVFAQLFNSAGAKQANQFRVNTHTPNSQLFPAVAIDRDGDAVIAWQSQGQDGSQDGIYAQRYEETTDTAAPVVGAVFINGERVYPYSSHQPALQQIVVSFSGSMSDFGGPAGANSITNPANWLLTRNGEDVTSGISSIDYLFNVSTNRHEAALNLAAPYTTGNFFLKLRDNVRDLAANRLDGDYDGAGGGVFMMPFSLGQFAAGPQQQVNTFTTNHQFGASVAVDADGDYVVVWNSRGQDNASGYGVYAQRFNAAGRPQGGETLVNTTIVGDQVGSSVAMDALGNFVVAWRGPGEGFSDIYARRFNAAGLPLGDEFRVNTHTPDTQQGAAMAMNPQGAFVIVWTSFNQEGSGRDVYGQLFNADGTRNGGEFRVNTVTAGNQEASSVAMDDAGNFVVTWGADEPPSTEDLIYAQRFNSAGLPVGGQLMGSSFGRAFAPRVAMAPAGQFVVTWTTVGSTLDIAAQRFDASGNIVGARIEVDDPALDIENFSDVAIDRHGNFIVTWQLDVGTGGTAGVRYRRFGADGTPLGSWLAANESVDTAAGFPSIAATPDGDFVIAWQSWYKNPFDHHEPMREPSTRSARRP